MDSATESKFKKPEFCGKDKEDEGTQESPKAGSGRNATNLVQHGKACREGGGGKPSRV